MSYRLGSWREGKPVPQLLCSNSIRKPGQCTCPNLGVIICIKCSLVMYCSSQCQRQHWSKHRLDCEHLYLNPEWKPTWVIEDRLPLLSASLFLPSSSSVDAYKNPGFPAYDCLQAWNKKGPNIAQSNIKICMTSAGDVRNLVQTVNSLPKNYSGKFDILLNNSNAVVLNQLATHLMYSASLSEKGASYVRHCAKIIYSQEFRDGDLSFQASLNTRGRGKLYAAQPTAGIKRPVEMIQDPFHAYDRNKILSSLRPSHRLALHKFWETGVLLPFSMGITDFTSPNRLLFNPQGEWMGMVSDINPLHGWDVAAVQRTGSQHGISSNGDILGSLFFHIKSELREFSVRMKEFNIHIHLSQYDSRLVSKGISIGLFPAFLEASFDRIDIGDMGDKMGVAESLADWAPLLNKEFPTSIAHNNPRAMKTLMERLQKVHSLKSKLKTIFKGPQDSSVDRLMASLDAFVDHEIFFWNIPKLKEHKSCYLTSVSVSGEYILCIPRESASRFIRHPRLNVEIC